MCSGPEAGMASINRSPRWSMCEREWMECWLRGLLLQSKAWIFLFQELSLSFRKPELLLMRRGSRSCCCLAPNDSWTNIKDDWLCSFWTPTWFFNSAQNVAERFSDFVEDTQRANMDVLRRIMSRTMTSSHYLGRICGVGSGEPVLNYKHFQTSKNRRFVCAYRFCVLIRFHSYALTVV